AAATIVCWPLGTCARALRIQCTRHRCQAAPSTRVIAWRKPSWASEITSLTPRKPRFTSPFRKPDQNGSASEGPMPRPTISRRPSLDTATAIIAATETMRPPSRTLRYVASSQRYGHSPSNGRSRNALTRSSMSLHSLRDLALRDTGQAHRLHQLVDPPGRDAADPGFLDHHDERLLGGLARLEEGREVRALP